MAQVKNIPLSVPHIFGTEWKYIKRCLDTGWVSTAGPYVDAIEAKCCQITGSRYAVATSSGTCALHVALQVVGVKPGDEVIVPTVTFIAPINCVRYVFADPIFMDCDEFYNIDAVKTKEFIEKETHFKDGATWNKRTRKKISALIPVHIFGNAARMEELIAICRKRNIKIIEDATESLGTKYISGPLKGKHTGTVGDIGCLSFNGNKIITAGGGGMILSDNADYAKRAKYLTTQAKDDGLYFIHHTIGYNFRLNNLQAGMGVAQLEKLSMVLKRKKANYALYRKALSKISGLTLAASPKYADNNHWMYPLLIDEKVYGRSRDELLKLFQKEKIEVRPLWHLNHLQKSYKDCQSYGIEAAYDMLKVTVNIPCSFGLTRTEINRVIGLLKKWKK